MREFMLGLNLQLCLQSGVKKLMQRAHVVFMIHDMQTYHEWFSLFPGLETKCDVMFVDDLTAEMRKHGLNAARKLTSLAFKNLHWCNARPVGIGGRAGARGGKPLLVLQGAPRSGRAHPHCMPGMRNHCGSQSNSRIKGIMKG